MPGPSPNVRNEAGRRAHQRWRAVGRVGACWTIAALALLIAPATAAAGPTVVSLTFDDTLSSQYQTGSMLAARGMHGTYFVNSSRVNEGGYMTKAQLRSLQSGGNEIAGHAVHHLDLLTVDAVEQKRQVCNDRSTLLGWGLKVSNFAYPFGSNDPALAQIVRDCGYNSARAFEGLTGSGADAETLPPADSFAIKTVDEVLSSTTLADLKGAVTRTEQSGGGWVIFVFHNVCNACGTVATSPSTFASFLDWLASPSETSASVATVRDVIGGAVKPAVPGPAPPPVRSGNMLINPSLELDANGNGFPDCWHPNTWLVSTSSWARTTDAHSGGFAARMDVTSFTSGAVRLISQQDLGYCGATAIPGHSYKLSAWHKGSARPRLVAFVRNSVGAWRVLGESDKFPKSETWKRRTWTTPALPSDVNGIGIAVAVQSVGSLTIDDLAVSDTASP